jgi:transposase InsO family protein
MVSDQPSTVKMGERAAWMKEKAPWCGLDVVSEDPADPSSPSTPSLNAEASEFVPGGGSQAEQQTQPKVAATEKKRIGPTVSGLVEGVGVKFLADTGAESTILSLRCYDTLPREVKMKFQDNSSTITMADGSSVHTKGPVLCNVAVGGRSVLDVVFVADIEDYALLGWDAQLGLGVVYSIAGVDVVSTIPVCRVYNTCVRHVRLAKEYVIPARSEAIVNGIVDGRIDGTALISPLEDTQEPGIAVARALVDISRGTCPVRILNPTEIDIVMKERDIVAGAEEADEVQVQPLPPGPTANGDIPAHLHDLYKKAVDEAKLDSVLAEQLKQLLIKHSSVFASSDDDLGRTTLVEHHIDTGDAPPIRQPPRRLPVSQQEDCEKEVTAMLAKGVIEPGQSPWASPVVLVRKKDGSLRFCVDYRRLNNVTKFDAYPLPRIDETLDALGGAKWFSTLDLISGYWQVGLTPEAKLKSAFCVRSGLYLWRVMPFGLSNAPSTFERLMETVLQGLQWKSCLVYLDDIVIFGSTEQQLMERMDDIFTRLHKAGLKMKPRKCRLFRRETDYLGHVICADGVKVSPEKVAAVRDWPVPECVTELRSFLGTASYYRKFVPGFANIAAPLHEQASGSHRYDWTAECQSAFEQLRTALCTAPVLAFPVKGARFVLDTDASDRGIGAVLSQLVPVGIDDNGQEVVEERVLSYASRTLNTHEKRYCTTRKELLAVVWFLRHYRPYLYGQDFFVRTDHSSLQWLCSFWEPEGQIARWLQILGEYTFKVIHREGKKHSNADGLSRQGPCKQCGKETTEEQPGPGISCPERAPAIALARISACFIRPVSIVPEWTPNQLVVWQEADIDIAPVLSAIKAGRKPAPEESSGWSAATKRLLLEYERLQLRGGVLYRTWYDETGKEQSYQLVTPHHIKAQVLSASHDGAVAGHYAERKTAAKVREYFFWPNLLSDVRRYCRSCVICQRRKPRPTRPHHPLQQDTIGEPMQKVTIDILGFERPTTRGNRYILVAVDTLTKWAEALPMPDERAETVARALVEDFICKMGIPTQIHSDQGRQFESAVFQEVCRLLGIQKTRTTPLHPQSDGQTERVNRTLLNLLAKMAADNPAAWDDRLPYAMAAYRSTPHSTTGETPNRLMLGREVTTPLQLLAPPPPDESPRPAWAENLHRKFQETHQQVLEHFGQAQRTQKKTHDRRQLGFEFKEGDAVWLLSMRPPKGTPYKLSAPWDGPFEVRKRLSVAVYVIGRPGSKKTQVVSTARLKAVVQRGDDLQPSIEPTPGGAEVADEDVAEERQDFSTPLAKTLVTDQLDVVPPLQEETREQEEESSSDGDYQPDTLVKEIDTAPLLSRPQRDRRPPRKYGEYVMNMDDDIAIGV